MSLFTWAESVTQKMKWYDVSILKTVQVLVGIIIGAFIPAFVKANLWWLISVVVILYALLLYRIFFK